MEINSRLSSLQSRTDIELCFLTQITGDLEHHSPADDRGGDQPFFPNCPSVARVEASNSELEHKDIGCTETVEARLYGL